MEEIFTFSRKRTLVSIKPVEPPCKIHKLSTLDLAMQNHHLHIIFYYNTPLLLGSQLGDMTFKIRESLAETLSYYHVIIGRLMKPNNNNSTTNNDNDISNNDNDDGNEKGKWVIKCNDAGLRIIEARVKGSVENWLENLDDVKDKMLVHWEDMSQYVSYHLWPTFYIKVTEFEEGGLALGLSCAHMLADPICATVFIKALTDTFLTGKITVPPLFHPLPHRRLDHKKSQQKHDNYLINTYKSILQSPSPSPSQTQNYRTITLEFKHHMVQSCLSSTRLNGPTHGTCSQAFIALVGLMWSCISRVKEGSHGLVDMSICLNMRKVLGLDQGYFGNCMVYNKVDGNGIRMDDLVSSTKAVTEAVEHMKEDDVLDLIEWLESYDNDISTPPVVGGDNLIFINLEDTGPYSSTSIEGYEPIRVSYYSESSTEKEKVLVLPSRPNEGDLSRVVTVTLPSDQVIKLCDDKFLAPFSPVIKMGPKHK